MRSAWLFARERQRGAVGLGLRRGRIDAVVGVEGDRVGIGLPHGVERCVAFGLVFIAGPPCGHGGVGAGSPAEEVVSVAGRLISAERQRGAVGLGLCRRCICSVVGVKGDRVGIGLPHGVEGGVALDIVAAAGKPGGLSGVGAGSPAEESVMRSAWLFARERQRGAVGLGLRRGRIDAVVGVEGDDI